MKQVEKEVIMKRKQKVQGTKKVRRRKIWIEKRLSYIETDRGILDKKVQSLEVLTRGAQCIMPFHT